MQEWRGWFGEDGSFSNGGSCGGDCLSCWEICHVASLGCMDCYPYLSFRFCFLLFFLSMFFQIIIWIQLYRCCYDVGWVGFLLLFKSRVLMVLVRSLERIGFFFFFNFTYFGSGSVWLVFGF